MQKTASNHVRTEDVRALLRLAFETRELRAAHRDTTLHMLSNLAAITQSDVAMEFAARARPGEMIEVLSITDQGWPTERDRARVYDHVLSNTADADALMAEVMSRKGRVATVVREEILSLRDWRRTELFNEIYVPSKIEDSMVSVVDVDGQGEVRVLVFKRGAKEPAYSERERDLVDLFLGECAWLYDKPTPAFNERTKDLSRRELQVLDILLTGTPEKQLATLIGVSRHTAHQYVKSIYRKLTVTSRAELMASAPSLRGTSTSRSL